MSEDGRLAIDPFSIDVVLISVDDHSLCGLLTVENDEAETSRNMRAVLAYNLAGIDISVLAEVVL